MTDELSKAKSIITIEWLWNYYKLPGSPKKMQTSPFRDEKTPSFSVYENGHRWKDFGTGEGGDSIDFIAQAEGISNSDACNRIKELAGGNYKKKVDILPSKKRSGKSRHRRQRVKNNHKKSIESLCEELCRSRGFPISMRFALMRIADRGILYFPDDETWTITDRSKKNAQTRRIDRGMMKSEYGESKSKTHPGSMAGWPIGLSDCVRRKHIILIEGGPDLLAAASFCYALYAENFEDYGFACMTGASQNLDPSAIRIIRNLRCPVTAFPHNDKNRAGAKGFKRWREVFTSEGCSVLGFRLNWQQGNDLSDLLENDFDYHRLRIFLDRR